ncbi:MAG TPA: exo-alpha-sialidase [Verrucomicrobiae bacterium]|nr:exo-alpha-sialidase [Verrucomicrobiae bacterium]
MLRFVFSALALCVASLVPYARSAETFQLISAKKIWHGAAHNAFTDLIRFHGKWFCVFRESQAHVGGNGRIRALASPDGDEWKSAALLNEEGIDLRDPKISSTPDGRLMIVMGGSVYAGKTLKERQSRVAFSNDGSHWSAPHRVLAKGDWLWRVTWNGGKAYGFSYGSTASSPAGKPHSKGMAVQLVESDDGISYRRIAALDVPGSPNETTLRFGPGGQCIALARREAGDRQAWIGSSHAPYTDWHWHAAGLFIGGPDFSVLPNGAMVASGRELDAQPHHGARTFVGTMTLDKVTPALVLPSGGDCSYPGMVWQDGILWISYYSSHEGATDIYLAKVKMSPEPKP